MRLVCKGVTHYKKVDLMREAQVTELYQRRRAILNGSKQANKADFRGKCLNCHQLKLCAGVKSFRPSHKATQGIKRVVIMNRLKRSLKMKLESKESIECWY